MLVILPLLLAATSAGTCPAEPPPLPIAQSVSESALAVELASCELAPEKAARIFALAGQQGNVEAGADGISVVFLHGYPEEVSLQRDGHPEGLTLRFSPIGLPTSSECWQSGVKRELASWSKGRKARAEQWDASGRRSQNVYDDVWAYGYSEAVEHYAPGGHISWTEAWSKYTGDRLVWTGSLFDRR